MRLSTPRRVARALLLAHARQVFVPVLRALVRGEALTAAERRIVGRVR